MKVGKFCNNACVGGWSDGLGRIVGRLGQRFTKFIDLICQEFSELIHPFDDFVMCRYLIVCNGVVVDEFDNGYV